MAKKLVWSYRAQSDRKEIFQYWNKRNKSKTYSRKLNALFNEAAVLIAKYPELGTLTDEGRIRVKVVNDYLMFYEEFEKEKILILTIWDSRRDPDELERSLRK